MISALNCAAATLRSGWAPPDWPLTSTSTATMVRWVVAVRQRRLGRCRRPTVRNPPRLVPSDPRHFPPFWNSVAAELETEAAVNSTITVN